MHEEDRIEAHPVEISYGRICPCKTVSEFMSRSRSNWIASIGKSSALRSLGRVPAAQNGAWFECHA